MSPSPSAGVPPLVPAVPPVPSAPSGPPVPAVLPSPRRAADGRAMPFARAGQSARAVPSVPIAPIAPTVPSTDSAAVAHWYRTRLGWPVAEPSGDGPVELLTGLAFDVLEVPADAGAAVLRRAAVGPVALAGDRALLLIAPGAADEVPGVLAWLEWGGVALDLTAVGTGGRMPAPPPPGTAGTRGAAVWLRPPVPGPYLPCLPEPPGAAGPAAAEAGGHPGRVRGPDLLRLLDTVATECHRARLLRPNSRTGIGYLCDCPIRE
ncbi:SCO3374 family protein [Streptomyces sp. NPDC006798]|uniref:SCO3374 family protein n=1 Tax=Streptomyces sp. NPDC006798 TaxID=3155462 RepID=UPI00340D1737